MSTQTQPQPQSRLSPEGYQTMIDRLQAREENSGIFGSRRREPSGNYLSAEGYDRMIAHISTRQSRGLAESIATGYNGVRTVVADTGKVVGAVYNGGARVVKGVAVGAAKTIGTAWNAGVDVHKYMREVRAAKANARRTQEMHDTQVMALMAQILGIGQQQQQGQQPNVNWHVYSNMPNGVNPFGNVPGQQTPNAAAYNAAAASFRTQPGQTGQGGPTATGAGNP